MSGFPWAQLSTEIWLCVLGLGLLVADLFVTDARRHLLGYAALAGLALALVPASGVCASAAAERALFGGLYQADHLQTFFRVFTVLGSLMVTLLSLDYLAHIRLDRGVYFALLVFATLAMVLLSGSNDLVMIYLSIEFLSITSYVLAGFLMGRDKVDLAETKASNEASLKYLIYGAVASGVMLYGFSLLYGLAGSTELDKIAVALRSPVNNDLVKLLALALVMVGLGFKISAVPFHQWAPDVYQGAPTPVAALLAVGSKGAAFALVTRFLVLGLGSWQGHWAPLLAILATASMFVGNLLAMVQRNVKRMLGYSGVAHAGYMLVALICNDGQNTGVQALLIYLMAYLLMNLGAFGFVVWYQRSTGSEQIDDYAGLARRDTPAAVALSFLLLSLTGIPGTAGFIGKLHVLLTTVTPQWWWLGLVVVLNSALSAYYYWNLARIMWLEAPREGVELKPAVCAPAVLYVCTIFTLVFGIQWGWLRDLSERPLTSIHASATVGSVNSAR